MEQVTVRRSQMESLTKGYIMRYQGERQRMACVHAILAIVLGLIHILAPALAFVLALAPSYISYTFLFPRSCLPLAFYT